MPHLLIVRPTEDAPVVAVHEDDLLEGGADVPVGDLGPYGIQPGHPARVQEMHLVAAQPGRCMGSPWGVQTRDLFRREDGVADASCVCEGVPVVHRPGAREHEKLTDALVAGRVSARRAGACAGHLQDLGFGGLECECRGHIAEGVAIRGAEAHHDHGAAGEPDPPRRDPPDGGGGGSGTELHLGGVEPPREAELAQEVLRHLGDLVLGDAGLQALDQAGEQGDGASLRVVEGVDGADVHGRMVARVEAQDEVDQATRRRVSLAGSGFDHYPAAAGEGASMDLSEKLVTEILPRVEKPSRYLGREWNRARPDPSGVDLRLVLAFPDLYDLGLGNLGLQVLYRILNARSGVYADRVCMPAPDLEAALKAAGLPLFGLESRAALSDFDGVAFSLQAELCATNVLAMLDLGGVPIRSVQRGDEHPLVFAGGPISMNPEPMADFFDFLVIGDGEEVVLDLVDALRTGRGRPRAERLALVDRVEGVYVPSLRPVRRAETGFLVPVDGLPRVRRRVVADLDGTPVPLDPVVPFTPQVHDRLSLEVMRGCTRGCRFCQAGMTSRPVRERTPATLLAALDPALDATGYEEVGLLSLSTCDHSDVREMLETLSTRARERRAAVSLPSLRADGFSVELASWLAHVRRTGLTFAPEAASPRLRAVINKWIPDDELLEVTNAAFASGWDRLKLYFMIGLPGETDEDVLAIADLALRVLREGRRRCRGAQLNLGVSTFVPKPHTPFQWAAQIPPEEAVRRQGLLRERLRPHPGIKLGWHNADESFLEGVFARGDRSVGALLEAAWRRGCRMDGWMEHRRMDLWREAMAEVGFDGTRALAARPVGTPLPWDSVDVGVSPAWLQREWDRALREERTSDCRLDSCHACGILTSRGGPGDPVAALCQEEARRIRLAPKPSAPLGRRGDHVEPEPVQRLFFRIGRVGDLRFLSNQETMTAWIRALRRAGAPLSFSQGFHAHARVAFSTGFPVGEESVGDYMDVVLYRRVEPASMAADLVAAIPPELRILAIGEVPASARSLMAQAHGFDFEMRLPITPAEVAGRLRAWEEGPVDAPLREKTTRLVQVGTGSVVRFETRAPDGRTVRPRDLLATLGLDVRDCLVRRLATRTHPGTTEEGRGGEWPEIDARWGLAPWPGNGGSIGLEGPRIHP